MAIDTSPAKIISNVKPQLLIDGKFVDAASGKKFKVINPHDESVICEVAEADKADVDKAVAAARKAFDEGPWPKLSAKNRGRILYKFADLIEQHAEELALIETLDNGKPVFYSRAADIPLTVDHFRYFAGWADKIHGKTIPLDDRFGKHFGYTLHEPIGVVAQVIPWNFPLLMFTWKVAPALAAGNTIVIKPAEQTPLTALRVGALALEAGIPPGVLNIIPGYGPTAGAPLVNHPDIDKICFTGSTEIGRLIGEVAGRNIKPVSLELGGKSATIVWKDVNVDETVEVCHQALFFNHGQCCAAGSRLFVHEDIYDEFVKKSAERAKSKTVGNPFTDAEQGPQIDEDQMQKILSYITSGKEQGATLLCGGNRHGNTGYYVEPTVFSDVKDDMKIAQEEIFGPVQTILKYKTLDEVIKRANSNPYGLASGIFAKDVDVINTVSRGLRAGTVWCNTYNVYDNAMPFGGYKQSGVGRDKGEYALEHYTQVKAVYQKLGDTAWY